MTTEPYTPDETELIDCYAASLHEHAGEDYATAKADAERGIAKIKADAIRVANSSVLAPASVTVAFEEYADRIEQGEA